MYEYFIDTNLVCLYKIGVVCDSDLQALILKVFAFYLAVCRNLQQVYWLEPAGSHGVWSLDDYQMLVFYFGGIDFLQYLRRNPAPPPETLRWELAAHFQRLPCVRGAGSRKAD